MALTAYHAAKRSPKPNHASSLTANQANQNGLNRQTDSRGVSQSHARPMSALPPNRVQGPMQRIEDGHSVVHTTATAQTAQPARRSRDDRRRPADRTDRRRSGPPRFRPPKVRMAQKPETPGVSLTAAKPSQTRSFTAPQQKLRVIPIGGLAEVGMNMMVYEYGNDMIIVDAGVLFPSDSMPGIDLVIPDITYVLEHLHKLRGIFITHGHEDHISALPYIYPRIGQQIPVYALPLTNALIASKLAEFNVTGNLQTVKAGTSIKAGVFTVDCITLTHTIPDAVGFGIHTPEGVVVHTGDWKFDHTPIWGEPTDYAKLITLSREGVLLLLSDSTNAEIPGYTISERVVAMDLDKIFKARTSGRIIMSAFASNINRLQIAINLSAKYGRKLAVDGRSMKRNVEVALKLGYVNAPRDILVDIRQSASIPDDKLTILCTGSQGEEYSALVRMSAGEHRQIQIRQGDTVVLSSSRIPGNEHAIYETIDNLFRRGADVVYGGELDIHTSGHAKQEEIKMMIAMLKPRYFMPLHGEYRMLKANAKLAAQMGVEPANIFVGENGAVLEIEQGKAAWAAKKVLAEYIMIDGLGVGDVGQIVLRDRQAMAEEGIFMVILTVDRKQGQLISNPDIISRGFVYMRDARELISKARREIRSLFARHNQTAPMDWEYVKRELRDDLAKFLYEYTQRQPMIIPVVIEV